LPSERSAIVPLVPAVRPPHRPTARPEALPTLEAPGWRVLEYGARWLERDAELVGLSPSDVAAALGAELRPSSTPGTAAGELRSDVAAFERERARAP
ncbi:MAG: hypothetical protein ACREK4_24325, partial [Candidatus Rokuibacteriota bacterium]